MMQAAKTGQKCRMILRVAPSMVKSPSTDVGTFAEIFAALAEDPRFADRAERCELLHWLVTPVAFLESADYEASGCGAWPIASVRNHRPAQRREP